MEFTHKDLQNIVGSALFNYTEYVLSSILDCVDEYVEKNKDCNFNKEKFIKLINENDSIFSILQIENLTEDQKEFYTNSGSILFKQISNGIFDDLSEKVLNDIGVKMAINAETAKDIAKLKSEQYFRKVAEVIVTSLIRI